MTKKLLAAVAIACFVVGLGANATIAAEPTVTGLTLAPGIATLTTDQTTTFTLTATLSDGTAINATELATWTPNGGGFTGIPGQKGLYTAHAQGVWSLTASYGGLTAAASITITHGVAVGLNVLPTGASITADGLLPMYFYGVDADGNGFDVSHTATLATNDPTGTVSPAGYAPGTAGTWVVSATLGALTDASTITVTPGMLQTLNVAPGELSVDPGDTAALVAKGYDADGNETSGGITWRATNENVATVDTNGNVQAKATGQTNIIAEGPGGIIDVLPVVVSGPVTPVETVDAGEVIAVSNVVGRTPQVAAEEVERSPSNDEPTLDESAQSTATNEVCKNIAHPWTIILLIAHLILLSVFFTALHRSKRYPWWWVPPLALTAALLGVYAGAFCNDTYLWWPWAVIGTTVIFLSVYYQRMDEPGSSPPSAPPTA